MKISPPFLTTLSKFLVSKLHVLLIMAAVSMSLMGLLSASLTQNTPSYGLEARPNASKIKGLSKAFGLFFVFSQNCPYCKQFAPIVKAFGARYGFKVLGISPDGQGVKEFPNPKRDNGILSHLNPQNTYPALFLVRASDSLVVPIARSFVSLQELEENILGVLDALEKQGAF